MRFEHPSVELPVAIEFEGRPVTVEFRGRTVTVIARESGLDRSSRQQDPILDPLGLELVTGVGPAENWPRPVVIEAFVEFNHSATAAVQAASRWASYGPRVAVSPGASGSATAGLEAALRGVWLFGVGESEPVVVGERSAVAGSTRGLQHRLLDELVWSALRYRSGLAVKA